MNWPAIIAGAVAAFAAGFLVYGPIGFGRIWAEGSRVAAQPRPPLDAMLWQVAALVLLALVIGLTETTQSLGLALAAILAVAAQAGAVGAWAQKTPAAIGVDVFYALLGGALMILAQALL